MTATTPGERRPGSTRSHPRIAIPVSWCSPSPAKAITSPIRAALSSANTARPSDPMSPTHTRDSRSYSPPRRAIAAIRLQQRGALEEERHAQHDVSDQISLMTTTGRMHQFRDRHATPTPRRRPRTGRRREQRPDVGLPAVADRMARFVGFARCADWRSAGSSVAGVRPGVRGLCDHRGRAGDHRGDRLGHGDSQIGEQGDEHGARAPTSPQRLGSGVQIERFSRPAEAGGFPPRLKAGRRRSRSLSACLWSHREGYPAGLRINPRRGKGLVVLRRRRGELFGAEPLDDRRRRLVDDRAHGSFSAATSSCSRIARATSSCRSIAAGFGRSGIMPWCVRPLSTSATTSVSARNISLPRAREECGERSCPQQVGLQVPGPAVHDHVGHRGRHDPALVWIGTPGGERRSDRLETPPQLREGHQLGRPVPGTEAPADQPGVEHVPLHGGLDGDAYPTARGHHAHRFQYPDSFPRDATRHPMFGADPFEVEYLPGAAGRTRSRRPERRQDCCATLRRLAGRSQIHRAIDGTSWHKNGCFCHLLAIVCLLSNM